MDKKEKIHTILLGFHNNTETFQSANEKIEALIDDAQSTGYRRGRSDLLDKQDEVSAHQRDAKVVEQPF